MKFSVIIPVYNVENYLEDCIHSVLNQSYKDLEIILVDDGSCDNSSSLCDVFRERYGDFVKVLHRENKGQLMSRCDGVNMADGDYCIFLDGDDMLESDCLETLYSSIKQNDFPDAVIYTLTKTDFVTRKRNSFPFQNGKVFEGDELTDLRKMFFSSSVLNSMCTKAVKTEILKINQGFFKDYSSLKFAEDKLQSMMSLTYCKRVLCIDESLYLYRMSNGSVTRNTTKENLDKINTRIMCDAEEHFLKVWGVDDAGTVFLQQSVYLNNAMYILKTRYCNAISSKERKMLIEYNWQSYVKEDYFKNLGTNSFVNPVYKKMWDCILGADKIKLKILLAKFTVIKKLKQKRK